MLVKFVRPENNRPQEIPSLSPFTHDGDDQPTFVRILEGEAYFGRGKQAEFPVTFDVASCICISMVSMSSDSEPSEIFMMHWNPNFEIDWESILSLFQSNKIEIRLYGALEDYGDKSFEGVQSVLNHLDQLEEVDIPNRQITVIFNEAGLYSEAKPAVKEEALCHLLCDGAGQFYSAPKRMREPVSSDRGARLEGLNLDAKLFDQLEFERAPRKILINPASDYKYKPSSFTLQFVNAHTYRQYLDFWFRDRLGYRFSDKKCLEHPVEKRFAENHVKLAELFYKTVQDYMVGQVAMPPSSSVIESACEWLVASKATQSPRFSLLKSDAARLPAVARWIEAASRRETVLAKIREKELGIRVIDRDGNLLLYFGLPVKFIKALEAWERRMNLSKQSASVCRDGGELVMDADFLLAQYIRGNSTDLLEAAQRFYEVITHGLKVKFPDHFRQVEEPTKLDHLSADTEHRDFTLLQFEEGEGRFVKGLDESVILASFNARSCLLGCLYSSETNEVFAFHYSSSYSLNWPLILSCFSSNKLRMHLFSSKESLEGEMTKRNLSALKDSFENVIVKGWQFEVEWVQLHHLENGLQEERHLGWNCRGTVFSLASSLKEAASSASIAAIEETIICDAMVRYYKLPLKKRALRIVSGDSNEFQYQPSSTAIQFVMGVLERGRFEAYVENALSQLRFGCPRGEKDETREKIKIFFDAVERYCKDHGISQGDIPQSAAVDCAINSLTKNKDLNSREVAFFQPDETDRIRVGVAKKGCDGELCFDIESGYKEKLQTFIENAPAHQLIDDTQLALKNWLRIDPRWLLAGMGGPVSVCLINAAQCFLDAIMNDRPKVQSGVAQVAGSHIEDRDKQSMKLNLVVNEGQVSSIKLIPFKDRGDEPVELRQFGEGEGVFVKDAPNAVLATYHVTTCLAVCLIAKDTKEMCAFHFNDCFAINWNAILDRFASNNIELRLFGAVSGLGVASKAGAIDSNKTAAYRSKKNLELFYKSLIEADGFNREITITLVAQCIRDQNKLPKNITARHLAWDVDGNVYAMPISKEKPVHTNRMTRLYDAQFNGWVARILRYKMPKTQLLIEEHECVLYEPSCLIIQLAMQLSKAENFQLYINSRLAAGSDCAEVFCAKEISFFRAVLDFCTAHSINEEDLPSSTDIDWTVSCMAPKLGYSVSELLSKNMLAAPAFALRISAIDAASRSCVLFFSADRDYSQDMQVISGVIGQQTGVKSLGVDDFEVDANYLEGLGRYYAKDNKPQSRQSYLFKGASKLLEALENRHKLEAEKCKHDCQHGL